MGLIKPLLPDEAGLLERLVRAVQGFGRRGEREKTWEWLADQTVKKLEREGVEPTGKVEQRVRELCTKAFDNAWPPVEEQGFEEPSEIQAAPAALPQRKIPPRRSATPAGEQPFVVRWRDAVCANRKLPIITRYVLSVLSSFMRSEGYCWPSQRALAAKAGMSERSVGAHVRRAIEEGWLRASPRKAADSRQTRPGRPGLAYQAAIPSQ